MTYSTIGILALIIHIIVNHDILNHTGKDAPPAQRAYLNFLLGIMAYYITDTLWGVFDELGLTAVQYADTAVYFVAMAAAVLMWTRYVVIYLEESSAFGRLLLPAGRIFFAFELAVVGVNRFWPILFWFDGSGAYHAGPARYMTLGIQILLFLLSAVHALRAMGRREGAVRRRYRTIGLFGLAMTILIAVQLFYPLLPLYSMGYMIGVCLLHTFVLEDEKEEYRQELEETIEREQRQRQELGSAKRLAYTDALTGVKSMHAYVEAEANVDQRINDGALERFGLILFDLNGLKRINDTLGHEVGDRYIVDACRLICAQFKHSPVYRIGGDEFVAFLEGEDYDRREALLSAFDRRIEQNLREGRVVVSTGMAEFDPLLHSDCMTVFQQADLQMYQRKQRLKEMGAVMRE